MKRISVALALLAAVTFVVAGCGGGGGGTGGGGGVDPSTITTLSGHVLDTTGSPVTNAQVTVDTGAARSILSGTTNSSGAYSIGSVPLGVSINIKVSKVGMNDILMNGLTIGTDAGSAVGMEILASSEAPPAGSTVSISPAFNDLATGETRTYSIEVLNSSGTLITPNSLTGWKSSVVVSGAATGRINTDDPTSFKVTGGTAGKAAKVTVLVTLANGDFAAASASVTIKSVDVPPPPPM